MLRIVMLMSLVVALGLISFAATDELAPASAGCPSYNPNC
jgi:hypothetical protein